MFPQERTDVACLNVLFSWCDTIIMMNQSDDIYLKQMKYDVQVLLMLIVFKCVSNQIKKEEKNPTEIVFIPYINVTFEAMFDV